MSQKINVLQEIYDALKLRFPAPTTSDEVQEFVLDQDRIHVTTWRLSHVSTGERYDQQTTTITWEELLK